jgi:hypothetical protein
MAFINFRVDPSVATPFTDLVRAPFLFVPAAVSVLPPRSRCTVTSCPAVSVYTNNNNTNNGVHLLCSRHFDRMWRAKHATSERCHLAACERLVYAKSKAQHMCRSHYEQMHQIRKHRRQFVVPWGIHGQGNVGDNNSSSSSTNGNSSTMSDDLSRSPYSTDDFTSELQDESNCFDDSYMDTASGGS